MTFNMFILRIPSPNNSMKIIEISRNEKPTRWNSHWIEIGTSLYVNMLFNFLWIDNFVSHTKQTKWHEYRENYKFHTMDGILHKKGAKAYTRHRRSHRCILKCFTFFDISRLLCNNWLITVIFYAMPCDVMLCTAQRSESQFFFLSTLTRLS